EKAKREAELRSTGWGWRRSFDDKDDKAVPTTTLGAVVGKEQSAPAQQPPVRATARRNRRATPVTLNWGDDASFNFRRGRRQKEDWAPKKEPASLLSDAQSCR